MALSLFLITYGGYMKRRHTPQEMNLIEKRFKMEQEQRKRDDPMGLRQSWNEIKGRPEFISRKRHPFDCGNARCGICSPHKLCGHQPTKQEIIADWKMEDV